MPLPINEHAIDEMHQGFNMVDDSMRNVNTTMESVLDSLNELVRINTQSMQSLVDMLKIDTESLEMARLQRAFDEEKQTEEDIVKPEITKEVKDNTDKNFAELMKNNAGLITGVTAAVLGLMAMKDWIAQGFVDGVKALKQYIGAPQLPEREKNLQKLKEKQSTVGLTSDEIVKKQRDEIAIEAMKSGSTAGQAEAMAIEQTTAPADEFATIGNDGGPSKFDLYSEKMQSPEQKKLEAEGKMGDIFAELPPLLRMESNLPDMDNNKAIATRKIDSKLREIETISKEYAIPVAPEVQKFIDNRRQPAIQKAEENKKVLQQLEQIEAVEKKAREIESIPIIPQATPPAGNYGISDSPSMKAFKASPAETKVNPSADSKVTMFVNDGSGYKDMNGKPIINNIDNSTNTTVVGGGNGGSSTGQYVGNATRTKSHQDAAASRNQ